MSNYSMQYDTLESVYLIFGLCLTFRCHITSLKIINFINLPSEKRQIYLIFPTLCFKFRCHITSLKINFSPMSIKANLIFEQPKHYKIV